MPFWTVPPEWSGETAFIVAGGPSAASQNLELLRGRKVIAINSSWTAVPFADFQFFGDGKWFTEFGSELLKGYAGRIVTTDKDVNHPRVLKLRPNARPAIDTAPLILSGDPGFVAIRRTSLTAAINMVVHLGAATQVWLGADGQKAADGREHHHKPSWTHIANSFDRWRIDMASMVKPLKARGIKVINASPGSAWADLWPVMNLSDAIAHCEKRNREPIPDRAAQIVEQREHRPAAPASPAGV